MTHNQMDDMINAIVERVAMELSKGASAPEEKKEGASTFDINKVEKKDLS